MALESFQWTCPLCGASGRRITNQGDPHIVGVNHLKSHIRASSSEVHGPPGALPREIDPAWLEESVTARTKSV